jgi:hypothetical protein
MIVDILLHDDVTTVGKVSDVSVIHLVWIIFAHLPDLIDNLTIEVPRDGTNTKSILMLIKFSRRDNRDRRAGVRPASSVIIDDKVEL